MANSPLALVVIVVATIQVAFATYPSKLCNPPHRIDYGGYSPYRPQYSVGSKIKFHCDKGYKLHGSSWTVCKWDKRSYWAYPPPVCKRIGCSYLKAPQYGKVRIDGHGLSSVAYYSCDYGYSLHGPSSRKCLHGGSWYGKDPICRPKRKDCPRLYAPKYGKIRVTGYGPDSVAYYSCDYGYDIHGSDSRKCLHDGSWYGKDPICRPKRKDCPRLYAPKYGKVRVTGYGPDSVAYYSCDYGYDIHGSDSRKCLHDGSWYGKDPICRPKRKDCRRLYAPKYGKVRVTGYGPDSVAYYSCDYGYSLHGLSSRKCLHGGSWYGKDPICRPKKNCPRLYAPKYGKVRMTGYGPNPVAYYSCDYGYSLHGPSSRKCLHGGSWYGKDPICRPKRKDCRRLYAPKYGKVRVTGYGPDSVAYYSCDYGYDIYGPSSRKCQYDGSWYGKDPICRPKRKDCRRLYAPKHGKVRVTGYGPDSVAYYSCDYGYAIYGPSSRKCQYDGNWYGKIPVCRPKARRRVCPKLYAPRYGKIRVTGYGADSKAHYSCDYGYNLYGLKWRKCLHNGSWYGKAPICHPVKY